MDFKDLSYLIAAAREENLSRAAEKLIVAQPTLSQSLSRLEKVSGCPLFQRVPHGLKLTEAGEKFVVLSEKILEMKDELDRELTAIRLGASGRVHFGISATFSDSLVPRVLSDFTRLHPSVEVIIHTETSAVLERLLLEGDLDIAVVVEPAHDSRLAYEVLFHEQILLAMAEDNPLGKEANIAEDEDYPYLSPAQLKDQRFVLSQERMRLRDSAEAFFQKEGIIPDIAVTTASISTAIHLAAHGVGIAFIPSSRAAVHLEPPLPRYYATADSLADWRVSMVTHPRRSPTLEAFIERLKANV